jgi:endoglycosylceramidase
LAHRRRSALAIAALLGMGVVIPACSGSGSSNGTVATPTIISSGAPLGPVHHVGTWIVDDEGRVVITHGLNLIWKTAPYYPPAFSDQDARFLASEGFSGARIGFLWTGVEPSPGKYDMAYVRRIAAINNMLGASRIRTLVDFHQDNYAAKYDGDGAPAWASLGANSQQAFQSLWDDSPVDGQGLNTEFERAWKTAVGALGNAPNILGLDLLNEPYPGDQSHCGLFSACPSFEQGLLAAFYTQLIGSLRKLNPKVLIFYEPIPQASGGPTSLPAPVSNDPNLGFTFHYYDRACGLAPEPASAAAGRRQDSRCTPAESAALASGMAYAQRAGTAVDLGEFGGSINSTDDANVVDLADQLFLNWTYWEYYTTLASLSPGLLIKQNKPGSEANARQSLLGALVVPYPEEVAGTPLSYSLDRNAWKMQFTYSTKGVDPGRLCQKAPTEIFVPARDYPHGYKVNVKGARVVSPRNWPWVQVIANPGVTQVTLAISRADNSTTLTTTTAHDPHDPVIRCD